MQGRSLLAMLLHHQPDVTASNTCLIHDLMDAVPHRTVVMLPTARPATIPMLPVSHACPTHSHSLSLVPCPQNLVTLPTVRRMGHATSLMDAMEAAVASAGVPRMVVVLRAHLPEDCEGELQLS